MPRPFLAIVLVAACSSPPTPTAVRALVYYNTERPHLGIEGKPLRASQDLSTKLLDICSFLRRQESSRRHELRKGPNPKGAQCRT